MELSTLDSYVYPKRDGVPQTQYWVRLHINPYLAEPQTGQQLPFTNIKFSNPKANAVKESFRMHSTDGHHADGYFIYEAIETPRVIYVGKQKYSVLPGLKISASITNDSNKFNNATIKVFTYQIVTSSPVLSASLTISSTEAAYIYATEYYNVKFSQLLYGVSDGVVTAVLPNITGKIFDSKGNWMGDSFTATTQFKTNWYYDPQISILLFDDQGDGSDVALAALVSLIVVPVVVVGVLAILLGVGLWWRKRRINLMTSKLNSTFGKEKAEVEA